MYTRKAYATRETPRRGQGMIQLAIQKPSRRSPDNPRSRRLRNPDQLRQRERYRPNPSFKRVKIGRRSGVKFGSRLTTRHGKGAQAGVPKADIWQSMPVMPISGERLN